MPRAMTLGTASARRSNTVWYLATTADAMQFYCFDPNIGGGGPIAWRLIDRLDRTLLVGAGDKATAKSWAQRMGLKTWAYVRV